MQSTLPFAQVNIRNRKMTYVGPARARNARAKRYAMLVGEGLAMREVGRREGSAEGNEVSFVLRHACPPFVSQE